MKIVHCFGHYTRLTENDLYTLSIEEVSKLWNLLAGKRIIRKIISTLLLIRIDKIGTLPFKTPSR